MKGLRPSPAAIKRSCKSMSNLLSKYRRQLSVGQVVRWSIGTVATLTLAWLSAGFRGRSHYVAPWQFIAILAAAVIVAILLVAIPRPAYSKLFSENVGWLTVSLGALSYPYWYWVAGDYGILPSQSFFEIAAQILPVLLLAAIIDVRQSAALNSYQLVLPVIAAFLGESAALSQVAFQFPDHYARVTGFAAVASSLVAVFLTLIFAVLADFSNVHRNSEQRKPRG
jgi:hypothetical protein